MPKPNSASKWRAIFSSAVPSRTPSPKPLKKNMHKYLRFGLATVAATILSFQAHAAQLQGKVVGVSDGDTITVLDAGLQQHRVRLTGIDAPEKRQPFGQVSKQSLANLVYGKTVSVTYDKQDRYGRILGRIGTQDGQDANLHQIQKGMAWHYKRYERDQPKNERRDYAEAEQAAQQAKTGLWSDKNPTPPWDWRRESASTSRP